MKTLKFKEELCSDPLVVEYGTMSDHNNERNILVNGIVTHLISSLKESFYDGDKMKESAAALIARFRNDCKMRYSRIEVDAQHVMTCEMKELDDNTIFIFKYIKVIPDYVEE